MIGGLIDDSTGPVYQNSLMLLDLETKTWHEKSQVGTVRPYV